MKHALRKYLAPCGSALFMVVSTMAALIVLVTAMYMSVLSSSKVQFATFSQEQAYVTSTSIGDMVYSYLAENKSSTLFNSMRSLNKGESVSTNGNDFLSFGGTSKEDDERLGAFDVSITYVYDIGSDHVFDLAVTVENNGVFETTHDFIVIDASQPKMRRINNFFTSTGYLPTDIWIMQAAADSPMYFDNEFVKFTVHKKGGSVSQSLYYNFDITALGSLEFDMACDIPSGKEPKAPLTWAIGNDFTIAKTLYTQNLSKLDLGGTASLPGRVIVGGDMVWEGNNGKTIVQNTEVYVFGDLYLDFDNNNLNVLGELYVKGNIYDTSQKTLGNIGNVHTIEGKYYYKDNEGVSLDKWGPEKESEIKDLYDSKMNPSVWPKWDVTKNTDNINVHFSSNGVAVIDQDGIISGYSAENTDSDRYLIIDTGKNPTDVRTLTLAPNYDNGDPVFSWNPWINGKTFVLTAGKGSLVIDVPEGVVYQDKKWELFGNVAWFTLLGGKIQHSAEQGFIFSNGDAVLSSISQYMNTLHSQKFVLEANDLKRCNGSLSKEANIANGACNYVPDSITLSNGNECKFMTCTMHGGMYDYDDKECTECAEIDEYYAGECNSLCIGRINESAFNSFYSTPDGSSAKLSLETFYNNFYGSSSGYLYPNVNIFLVSDSENAEIYFGKTKYTGDNVYQSAYFGYIYAPYMTYAIDGGGSDTKTLRGMGGLVVSDIILASDSTFLFAQPDISIPGLVGPNWRENILDSFDDKSWRMHHGGT